MKKKLATLTGLFALFVISLLIGQFTIPKVFSQFAAPPAVASANPIIGYPLPGYVTRWSSKYGTQAAIEASQWLFEAATGLGVGTTSPRANLDVNVPGSSLAATFTPNLSSFTVVNATGVYTMTTLNKCVAQSTFTLTLPASVSTVWVSYVGSSSNTVVGSTVTVGVLIDGGYATIGGVAETSSKGILSVGSQNTIQSGYDIPMSFGPLPITGLTSGSHTLCMTIDSTAGTISLDSANELSMFTGSYFP